VDLPICLDTPSKLSKKVKKILLGIVYYFVLLYMKKDIFISLYFALDLLELLPTFNLLLSIVSCSNSQYEGENKITAKFCSDCEKLINGMNTIFSKT
jgi:hypothetical protein